MDAKDLESIPLFASLSKDQRQQVARLADEVDLPEGKRLIEEGQFGYEFFVLERGTVGVARGGETIAELGPGDFFGEMALEEADRRNATVTATSPVRAIVMTRQAFHGMERDFPEVARQIREAIEQRRPD